VVAETAVQEGEHGDGGRTARRRRRQAGDAAAVPIWRSTDQGGFYFLSLFIWSAFIICPQTKLTQT
jgi:hypothetical protein